MPADTLRERRLTRVATSNPRSAGLRPLGRRTASRYAYRSGSRRRGRSDRRRSPQTTPGLPDSCLTGRDPKRCYFPSRAMVILVFSASASRVMVTVFSALLVVSVKMAFPSDSWMWIFAPNLSL